MGHHEAFLAEIIAQPDDDVPRLVYADYLEESGDPDRADFIRIQCERAQRDDAALTAREDALWREHSAAWFLDGGPFGGVTRKEPHPLNLDRVTTAFATVRRGFVEVVLAPLAWWLEHGPRIARTHPVRKIMLSDRQATSEEGRRWHWRLSCWKEAAVVPQALFALLREKSYDFWIPANDDLWQAALRWAKQQ